MSSELVEVTQAVAEFDRVAAGLAELESKYKGVVYEVTTTKGMTEAKEARRAVREPRIEVEKIRKAAKAPILALGKKLDAEAARITKALEAIEGPLDDQIKAEESRQESERQEKVEAEIKRVSDLQARIGEIRAEVTRCAGLSARELAEILELWSPLGNDFQEFQPQAEDAYAATLAKLRELHSAAVAHEAEQAKIKAEREELARLKAEQAVREAAERARIAEEERAARKAIEARAAREAEVAQQRRIQEEQERATRQALIDAENARIKAEQEAERELLAQETERIAAERAESERQAKEAREAQEAEDRRIAAARAELERQQREAREAEERKAEAERIKRENRELIAMLTAEDIVRWIASEYGCEWVPVAARIAAIPHEDWLVLAAEKAEEAA